MVAGHVARRCRAEPEVLVGRVDIEARTLDRHGHDHVVELVDIRQVGQDTLVDVDERELRGHADGIQHGDQQDGVVLAIAIAITQRFPRGLWYVGAASELDGFVVQLPLHIVTDDLYLAARIVCSRDEARRHVRDTPGLQFPADHRQVIIPRPVPALARRADRYPGKHAIVIRLHRLPAVNDRIRRFPDQRTAARDGSLDTGGPETQPVMLPRDEYGAIADRAATRKIVDIQWKLVFVDTDVLGHDNLNYGSRRQARHRQMGGLFRARLVAVDGAGYVISCGVGLSDDLAARATHDQAVDIELLEGGIEVEFQRAEIRDTLRVLHLDLLHLRAEQVFAAVEVVSRDSVQEPGAVAIDRFIEGGTIDQ